MDPFMHLNYCYPGTLSATPLQASPTSCGSSRHVPEPQSVQLMQDETHQVDGYMRSDPGRMLQSRRSIDSPTQPGSRLQQASVAGVPRSNPTSPIQPYYEESTDFSDQYVPSSSDKITCTDHRPLDEIFGNMSPSSGSSRTKPRSPHPPRNGTPLANLRHASVLTYTLPMKPQLEGVLQIPLLAVDNQLRGTGLIVDFKCSDWGIGVQVEGITMLELLHGNVSGLENPHQRVLDGFGLTKLRFNILWPHYPPFVKVMSAFGTDGKPMTRAQLGYEVSLAFAEFFYQITSQSILPAQPGPYTISSMSPGSSSPGIRFDQLHLITVRNTSCGEWMAEIRAVLMS